MFIQAGSDWPDPLFSSTASQRRTMAGLIISHKFKEEISLSLKLKWDKNIDFS